MIILQNMNQELISVSRIFTPPEKVHQRDVCGSSEWVCGASLNQSDDELLVSTSRSWSLGQIGLAYKKRGIPKWMH